MSAPQGATKVIYKFNSSYGFGFSFEVEPPAAEGGFGVDNVHAAIQAGAEAMMAALEGNAHWVVEGGSGFYSREYVGDIPGDPWPT